ncbi:glycosyltransferase [Flavobacterium sp. CYK-4]|uniref:glycosyltransferase family 2 protein n=1 Tax=Flavobacterium lotistagni TaxID=2709660 RepID=UPI0014090EB4|nr:glycosyltransferase [Flavobacterium lotistagni]NHM06451.1 glycosyltransferase [Flavobacterium lotistagni]
MGTLVTVAVATYNSAVFVEETLESIFNQSYRPIALVVSDDCSKDSTVAIVQQWLLQERVVQRFESIQLITVAENTGISANSNRCIAAAPSDWIKFLAGDDILLPNCITDNMAFAQENPKAKVIFSQVRLYQDHFNPECYIKTLPLEFPNNLMHPDFTAQDQYKLLLVSDRINYTPSYFFNKKAVLKVGGYDEANRLIEDYPMWLQLTASGEKLYYHHHETVGYRIHQNAANNVGDEVLFKPSVLNSYLIRKKIAHPFLPFEIGKSEQLVYGVSKFFQSLGWNKNKGFYRSLYRLSCFYLNPFYYIFSLKKRLPENKTNFFYH